MDSLTLTFVKYGVGVIVAVLFVHYFKHRVHRKGLPLPPGPRGLSFIGNALDLPPSKSWLTYAKWSKQYGPVLYLEAFGQPIVILDSIQTARDLLEKNGVICSDRPRSVMLDLCQMSWPFVTLPYGDAWRARRRVFHTVNLADQVVDYQPGQLADAHLFLQGLVDNPEDFVAVCRGFVGSNALRTTYGIRVKGRDDPLLALAERAVTLTSDAVLPGKWIAEFLPWMRHIPPWTPGATFARFAADVRVVSAAYRQRVQAETEAAHARVDALPSMTARMLEQLDDGPDRLQIVFDASDSAFLAGVDSSVGALLNFIYAMACHPEVQTKAQCEIDAVVGRDRLPDFSDRSNLPYVQALISETLRWKVIAPLAIPHVTLADLEYKGFFLPKKTIVIANSWSILHDPAVYPEPESFKPERFLHTAPDGSLTLNPEVPDPRNAVFGYGRRVCPGRHIAENTLFAGVVSFLSSMTANRPTDAYGTPEPMYEEWSSGVLDVFTKFKCTIRLRDERAASLVKEAAGGC